jgi:hypothetical protein
MCTNIYSPCAPTWPLSLNRQQCQIALFVLKIKYFLTLHEKGWPAMGDDYQTQVSPPSQRRSGTNIQFIVGLAAGIAVIAGWSALRAGPRQRRYGDHAGERRAPLSLFTGGPHPRRRHIDRSGAHPLFERRKSVYDSY